MSVSCNAEFSDSKVIAVIAKRVFAEKKCPKILRFCLTRSYFSDCTQLFLAKVRIVCSSTATHPQHYCG